MLFSRLQNLLAITVWPQSSGNTLDVSDNDAGLFFHPNPIPHTPHIPHLLHSLRVHTHTGTNTDLLLFGNVPRTATPINEPSTSLAPHGGALGGSETGTGSTADGPRFLDTYSEADIRGFFRDFKLPEGQYKGRNFNEMFEDLGFKDLVFDIDVSDSFVHRVQLYTHSKTPENLLAQFAPLSPFPF